MTDVRSMALCVFVLVTFGWACSPAPCTQYCDWFRTCTYHGDEELCLEQCGDAYEFRGRMCTGALDRLAECLEGKNCLAGNDNCRDRIEEQQEVCPLPEESTYRL